MKVSSLQPWRETYTKNNILSKQNLNPSENAPKERQEKGPETVQEEEEVNNKIHIL